MKSIKDIFGNLSRPAKASMVYTVCNIFQKGISFCVVPIYTRIMDKANYGYYTTFLSWMTIISVIATLNLSYHVYINGIMKYENDRDGYTSSMLGLSTTITTLVFIIYLVGKTVWDSFINLPTVFMILMFCEIYVQPSFEYWGAYQRFQYKYKKLALLTMSISFLIPIVSIPLIIFSDDSLKGMSAIFGRVIVTIIGYMIPLISILKSRKKLFNKVYWEFALKFNIPLIPHFLSVIILQQSDRIMIRNLCGEEQVAMYSVAFAISTIMTILNTAIMNSMIPWTYQGIKAGKYKSIRSVSSTLCIVIAVVNLLVIFIAPDIMSIMAPPDYKEGMYVISPLVVSVYFMFVVNLYVNIEYYYAKTLYVMLGSIGAAVLNIILNLLFINRYGFVAAGYTTMASYILYCLGHLFFSGIVLKKMNPEHKSIYDNKMVFVLGGCLVVLSLSCSMIFEYSIIRYCLLLVILSVLFLCRNKIISQYKMLKS